MKGNCALSVVLTAVFCFASLAHGKDYPVKVLLPGNWADPTVVKVGQDYYLTANNDDHVPSVMIFHSRNLRRWEPLGYASPDAGQGLATDIAWYDDKLYVYGGGGRGAWAMVSEPPYTQWSARVNMQPLAPHGIDAGHIADGEGNRYLYGSRGLVVEISPDGLRARTAPRHVYDGWPIPEDLAVECFCLESPKLFKRGNWYYLVSAQGGTAGPATSHMAVVARSTDVMGPWVESPHNPLIWTESASEAWWSKGHATLIEGPEGHWHAIYHGYPNGQRSFGRCTLISPVQWTADGWPVMASTWPDGWGEPVTVEWPLSDEFDGPELGVQWQSLHELDRRRYRLGEGKLEVRATGDDPGASYPLTVNPKDLAYEVEAELAIEGDVTAGLILFYSPQAYVSLGLSHEGKLIRDLHRFPGQFRGNRSDGVPYPQKRIKLRLRNDRQDASAYYQDARGRWVKLERSDDISAMQHNLYGGFISIRPGLFAAGQGKAAFTYFTYRGL